MQESTPRDETSRDLSVDDGDANPIAETPSWREQRWVVLVYETVPGKDEKGNRCKRAFGLYIVDPKTGGAASIYDPETWADASRVGNHARLADVESSDQFSRGSAYVDGEGRLRWPDGRVVERHP